MSRRAPPTTGAAEPPTPVEKLTRAVQSPTEDELVSVCRTAVGDTLRSVIHFTRTDSELLYLRRDLAGADRRRTLEAKATLVERERIGFALHDEYEPRWAGAGSDPALGDYEFTVRVLSEGFVCRIITGSHGLLLTAEDLDVDRVEEVAIALRGLLAAAYGS